MRRNRQPIVKRLLEGMLGFVDLCLAPFVLIAGFVMKIVRRVGVERLPISRRVLSVVGVFPIADHYYEPLVNFSALRHPLDAAPGWFDLTLPLALAATSATTRSVRPAVVVFALVCVKTTRGCTGGQPRGGGPGGPLGGKI